MPRKLKVSGTRVICDPVCRSLLLSWSLPMPEIVIMLFQMPKGMLRTVYDTLIPAAVQALEKNLKLC